MKKLVIHLSFLISPRVIRENHQIQQTKKAVIWMKKKRKSKRVKKIPINKTWMRYIRHILSLSKLIILCCQVPLLKTLLSIMFKCLNCLYKLNRIQLCKRKLKNSYQDKIGCKRLHKLILILHHFPMVRILKIFPNLHSLINQS